MKPNSQLRSLLRSSVPQPLGFTFLPVSVQTTEQVTFNEHAQLRSWAFVSAVNVSSTIVPCTVRTVLQAFRWSGRRARCR